MTKKAKTILLSVLSGVMLVGIGLVLCFLILFTKKLDAPKNLLVADNLPNSQILVHVDEVSDAERYMFQITFGQSVRTLYSSENYLDVTSFFESAGKYKIKCKAIGKTSSSISDFSDEISYEAKIRLETPLCELDGNKLIFTEVQFATSYSLIYGINENDELLELKNPIAMAGVGKRYFDLTQLNAGEYSLQVIAKSENFRNSLMSTAVVYERITKFDAPSNITFSQEKMELSFTSTAKRFQVTAYGTNFPSGKTLLLETTSAVLGDYLNGEITRLEIIALGSDLDYTISSDVAVWQKS